jgi:Cof subfamily protein (haloacid dehalogenase superfamily)
MDPNSTKSIRIVNHLPNIEDVRLIATDFDGTLANSKGQVSERTRAALAVLEKANIEFVVITGRPPRYCNSIVNQTQIPTRLICANGALSYDPLKGTIEQFATINLLVAIDLIEETRRHSPDAAFSAEMGTEFVAEGKWLELAGRPLDENIRDIIPYLNHHVHKLLVNIPGQSPDSTINSLSEIWGPRINPTHAGLPFVELMPPGIDKAFGLQRLCNEKGIDSSSVIAFGDMPNDNAMLAWAGWGIAMANAHKETLLIANEITDSNIDDGVAVALEKLFS